MKTKKIEAKTKQWRCRFCHPFMGKNHDESHCVADGWEDDKVKTVSKRDGASEYLKVVWVHDSTRFGMLNEERDWLLYFHFGEERKIEVIGNVYENADLLKEVESR